MNTATLTTTSIDGIKVIQVPTPFFAKHECAGVYTDYMAIFSEKSRLSFTTRLMSGTVSIQNNNEHVSLSEMYCEISEKEFFAAFDEAQKKLIHAAKSMRELSYAARALTTAEGAE